MEVEIMRFDETELRLGLPGGGGGGGGGELLAAHEVVGSTPTTPTTAHLMIRKRGFSETVDLQLNLSSSPAKDAAAPAKSEDCTSAGTPEKMEKNISLLQAQESAAAADLATSKPPPAKAQVVGWPPVRSFRKNMVSSAAVQKSTNNKTTSNKDGVSAAESEHKAAAPAAPSAAVAASGGGASFVKVSMDGAPYLRKVDLKMYGSYRELSDALTKMFGSVKESNDYVPTYEDKDGDWMLVGDVPWGMFVESCKRLRIMKSNEAIGLAPRAMEKRKNMS